MTKDNEVTNYITKNILLLVKYKNDYTIIVNSYLCNKETMELYTDEEWKEISNKLNIVIFNICDWFINLEDIYENTTYGVLKEKYKNGLIPSDIMLFNLIKTINSFLSLNNNILIKVTNIINNSITKH